MSSTPIPVLQSGTTPLLISVPHAGMGLLTGMAERMTSEALELPDTDWFVDRLYQWAAAVGVSMICAPLSRYVVDLNRPVDNAPLYSAKTSSLLTGLFPMQTFSGSAVYQKGQVPTHNELEQRIDSVWRPYHDLLNAELKRIKSQFGHAVLLDAHSIRSALPLLFDGRLPDLNLGTNEGRSAAGALIRQARDVLAGAPYSMVLDGRFKGGYITRHYGRPGESVHALQLELAQATYMDESRLQWSTKRAAGLQSVLQQLIETLVRWCPTPT